MGKSVRYFIFLCFLLIMVLSAPTAVLYGVMSLIHLKYMAGLSEFSIPIVTYLFAASQMSENLIFFDNSREIKSLLSDVSIRKITNIISLGFYNSLMLLYLIWATESSPGTWQIIRCLPLINWFRSKEFLADSYVKKMLPADTSVELLFIRGDLIPCIFDAINNK